MKQGSGREIDRISELPDSIIHVIFGLMGSTKDVVRTQILSKNWKRVFDSYQTFDFDESWFLVHSKKARRRDQERIRKEEVERFKEYVEKSLATRLDCVDKFRLHVERFSDVQQCVAGWIGAAIAKNVKELDVVLDFYSGGELPIDLTQSSSITRLKIKGAPLHRLAAMKMCNLREISIKSIRLFDVNAMKKLEENCPLLQDLKLAYCRNLLHLNISSLNKLKRVAVKSCFKVEYIKIASPNLTTFEFLDDSLRQRSPNLTCSKNLRNLSFIKCYHMSDSEFEDRLSMFPLLENLELIECSSIKKPKICSLTLEWLTLKDCSCLDKVEVDAPNLDTFLYKGCPMPFPFVNAPRLSDARFCFENASYSDGDFFWNLDASKGFKLLLVTTQNMKIVEDPREKDLYQTNYSLIILIKPSSKVVERFEFWLRRYRVKTLVVVSSTGELLKSINKLIIEREEKYPRRYFKGVRVSTSEDGEKTSHVFRWRYRKTKSSSEKN